MSRFLKCFVFILLYAAPVSAQDNGALRARLIEDLLCGDAASSTWTELKENPGTVTTLIAILRDSAIDVTVRRSATHYLARLDDPRANTWVEELIRDAMNPSNEYTTAAIAGLSARSDSTAVGLLRLVLERGDYSAQHAALYALGQMQSPEAIELLRVMEQHPNANLRIIARRLVERRQ